MEDYRDLVVWQKSMELTKIVYALSKQLPKVECPDSFDILQTGIIPQ